MKHMSKILATLGFAATAALGVQAAPAAAQSAPSVRVGTLQCDVSGGVGMIIGSTRSLDCIFDPVGGPNERYVGVVRHSGLDVGITGGAVMVWTVLSSSSQARFPLSGVYVGAQASGSVGVGLGANALLGGSNRNFALQPISAQAQTGLNIAVGVAELTLEPVSADRRGAAPRK